LQDRGRWGLLRGPLISERRVLMRINLLLDPDPGRLSIPGEGNPSLSPFPSGLLDFFGRAWLEASCEIPVTPRRHGSIETSKQHFDLSHRCSHHIAVWDFWNDSPRDRAGSGNGRFEEGSPLLPCGLAEVSMTMALSCFQPQNIFQR
jgi:hypothetical protein